VVLYLVDASQAPQDVGYLDAELQVLALAGKPAIVLLNQLGAPGQPGEAELEQRWRERLAAAPGIHAVLPLDAFSRCWVQEGVLWQAVAPLLQADAAKRAAFERLQAAWRGRQMQTWRASMAELARRLARAAADTQAVATDGIRGSMRALGSRLSRAIGLRDDDGSGDAPQRRAMAQLAERLDADVKHSTDALIALHGLDGRASGEVLAKLARHYAVTQPIDEGHAAVWGGVVTGALAGLKADIATGGLTLGGGLLAGGVIGALTAAGAARGVNLVRGVSHPSVRWEPKVLDALAASALLGYLAVAHHGRGRGAWVAQQPPAAWVAAVDAALAERRAELERLWREEPAVPAQRLQPLLEAACTAVLVRLYPSAADVMGPPQPAAPA
jgi:hypothetical protein